MSLINENEKYSLNYSLYTILFYLLDDTVKTLRDILILT